MSIKNPATFLLLLKKAKTVYDKKPPDPKSKPEVRHKEIVKDLQRLQELARKKATAPNAAKPFAARKRILLKKLAEHRKKLNSPAEKNENENKAQLPAYLKALLRLSAALNLLDYASLSDGEEGDVNLDTLPEGNPAELDALDNLSEAELAALEKEDSAELLEPGEAGSAGGPVPAAPPVISAKPAAPAVSGVAVTKRLLALTAPYNAAVARNGPQTARLQALYKLARGQVNAKEFAKADATLTALEPLLKAGEATQAAPSTDGVAVVKRLLAAGTPLKAALARKAPDAAKLQALYDAARAAVDGKEFTEAAVALDELEPLLPAPPADKPGRTATAWQATRTTVEKQVAGLLATLRAKKEPDLEFIADKGGKKLAKQLEAGLDAALAEFDNAPPETRAAARAKVEGLLVKYRAFVKQDLSIRLMDENPFGAAVAVQATLNRAFDFIDKALQG
jgi:hypothetical protein